MRMGRSCRSRRHSLYHGSCRTLALSMPSLQLTSLSRSPQLPFPLYPQHHVTMLSRRLATTQLRSPILRQVGRRQLHGAGETGLHGAADNAFNRERAAVKEHAAGTSGMHKAHVVRESPTTDQVSCRSLAQTFHLVRNLPSYLCRQ